MGLSGDGRKGGIQERKVGRAVGREWRGLIPISKSTFPDPATKRELRKY